MSKRINITLPDSVVEELECWAEAQGRSLANLAAFLLESSVKRLSWVYGGNVAIAEFSPSLNFNIW